MNTSNALTKILVTSKAAVITFSKDPPARWFHVLFKDHLISIKYNLKLYNTWFNNILNYRTQVQP